MNTLFSDSYLQYMRHNVSHLPIRIQMWGNCLRQVYSIRYLSQEKYLTKTKSSKHTKEARRQWSADDKDGESKRLFFLNYFKRKVQHWVVSFCSLANYSRRQVEMWGEPGGTEGTGGGGGSSDTLQWEKLRNNRLTFGSTPLSVRSRCSNIALGNTT